MNSFEKTWKESPIWVLNRYEKETAQWAYIAGLRRAAYIARTSGSLHSPSDEKRILEAASIALTVESEAKAIETGE